MTSTVTKKTVYVRGPNNVYRRKSHDTLSLASVDSGDLSRRKGEVDSALNDLMVCGFQVPEDPATKRAKMKTKRPSASSSTDLASNPDPPSPRISFNRSYSDLPKTSWMDNLSLLQSRYLPRSVGDFAIPYVLGIITAVVIQQKWDLLTRYAKSLTYILLMGLVWAVLAAGAFWYAGMLDVSSWENITSTFTSLMGLGEVPNSSSKPVNYHFERRGRRTSSLDESADTDSVLLSETESDFDPRRKMRTESEPHLVREPSPQKLTNVRPFMPPSRRDSADSKMPTQILLNRLHSDGPTSTKKSRFRLSLPERERPRDPRRHSSASLELSSKEKQKPLPPLQRTALIGQDTVQDLPLVHEIKLKSRFDQQLQAHQQLQALENSGSSLNRLDTMLSKQSMLGTRANKRTFLSNVDET